MKKIKEIQMSVPAFMRHESELNILKVIDVLFKEIVSLFKCLMCVAKKNKHLVFPMLDNVRKALYAINNANNHNLKDDFEKEFRRKFQMAAFEYLNDLVIDCKIFMEFNRSNDNVKIAKVLDLVNNSKIMLKSWMKSDKGKS